MLCLFIWTEPRVLDRVTSFLCAGLKHKLCVSHWIGQLPWPILTGVFSLLLAWGTLGVPTTTSWALFKSISIQEVCSAGCWPSPHTSAHLFYKLDVTALNLVHSALSVGSSQEGASPLWNVIGGTVVFLTGMSWNQGVSISPTVRDEINAVKENIRLCSCYSREPGTTLLAMEVRKKWACFE